MDINDVWLETPAAVLVAQFHQAFGHPISNEPITAEDLETDLALLRMNLIEEEFKELKASYSTGDVIGFIDALQDLKYVIYGAELALGISGEEHFAEVHEANMRKLGPDGKPIYREDGKVLKPEGWTGPDHQKVLEAIDASGGLYVG